MVNTEINEQGPAAKARNTLKIIFLDADGVLNSDDFFKGENNRFRLDMPYVEQEFEIEKVELLKNAVEETDAKVVLTASCRYTRLGKLLKELLCSYGIEVIDSVPNMEGIRGEEIKAWLNEHPKVEKFVILDDIKYDSYDEKLIEHLVQTTGGNGEGLFGNGLMSKDVEEIIRKLGRKDSF